MSHSARLYLHTGQHQQQQQQLYNGYNNKNIVNLVDLVRQVDIYSTEAFQATQALSEHFTFKHDPAHHNRQAKFALVIIGLSCPPSLQVSKNFASVSRCRQN